MLLGANRAAGLTRKQKPRERLHESFSFPGYGQHTWQRSMHVAMLPPRPIPPFQNPVGTPLRTSKLTAKPLPLPLAPLPPRPATHTGIAASSTLGNPPIHVAWLRRNLATPTATRRVNQRLAVHSILTDAGKPAPCIRPQQLQALLDVCR